jgi:type IV pilus assembly protein PilE
MRDNLMHKSLGQTLIELLLGSSLLAVVTTMTIPGVAGIMQANRRIDGQMLLLVAAKQQKNHLIYKYRFARDAGELGYRLPALSHDGHYQLQIVEADQGSFLMRALPVGAQAADRCGFLELDHRGRHQAQNGADDCWG